ncbi:hypothetical protein LWI28_020701 [Acer negundo]|uniref:SKP1 component POZ domain-containing protein n=1 Tax=Acer negundo TaxID=4023 RepID=A0AAD5IB68_ACENE|nr:hypothetical protein LWI28_020701 [Acer negundo]
MASSSSPTQEKKILLKEADGELFEVKELVAMKMETVKPFFVDNDNVTNDMVVPLQNVSTEHMSTIISFYKTLGVSEEDSAAFRSRTRALRR